MHEPRRQTPPTEGGREGYQPQPPRTRARLKRRDTSGFSHLSDFNRIVQSMQIDTPDGYTDMPTFNTVLGDFVLNNPTLIMAPASYSTMNGRQRLN